MSASLSSRTLSIDSFSESPPTRPWSPAVDIAENENELVLTADIPGVKLEEIDIKLEDGTLSLRGKREFEKKQEKGGYHRIERSYGTFQRVFTLPETVDVEKVSAQFDSGVLKITLPKKEVAKPKSVKISVGSSN
ncbi:MAG: Hsp20/alpha crystallin family protein [Paludibaculum sp.]